MSTNLNKINTKATAQNQRIPGRKDQVKNNAGGFVFEVTPKNRLERFLILGSENNYYIGGEALTRENADFLIDLISKDEALVQEVVEDVAVNNRAKKVDPTIFALAALFQYGEDKKTTRGIFQKVVRTSTHLFSFLTFAKNLGGMGRAKRAAIAEWYENKSDDSLAYQLVKYRQRNGWTHRDALRVSHARPSAENANFALGKGVADNAPAILKGFEKAQAVTNGAEAVKVLNEYKNLPWETLPTEVHASKDVWKTLFENGALKGTALVRNITRLARLGMFKDMDFATKVADRIVDDVPTARIHPVSYLVALVVHQAGQVKGNERSMFAQRQKNWETSPVIVNALEKAYDASFAYVEPSNKRFLAAIDVSGSMDMPALGMRDLSAAQVAGSMAMTLARTEPKTLVRGFTGGFRSATLTDLQITASTDLNTAMRNVHKSNFGRTDCAQPMLWAMENEVPIDTFVVITDNETWAGHVQPAQALKQYRQKMGIDARLIVLAASATGLSIADPRDAGMMDIAGFDPTVPGVISDFSAGRL